MQGNTMLWHTNQPSAHPERAKRYRQHPDSAPHLHSVYFPEISIGITAALHTE